MKTDEYKFTNKTATNKDPSKNQLTETIFQRQKFKIQELLNEKYNSKSTDKFTNELK